MFNRNRYPCACWGHVQLGDEACTVNIWGENWNSPVVEWLNKGLTVVWSPILRGAMSRVGSRTV
eukprot:3648614-Pyramimonas_sp.AAC.1